MKLDFKNILIGIIIGFILAIFIGCLLNDVYVDVRIGDEINNRDILID